MTTSHPTQFRRDITGGLITQVEIGFSKMEHRLNLDTFDQFAFSRKQLHRVCRPQQQHWRQRQQQQLFRNRVPQVGFAQ
jgi:hypothetical protein